MDKVLRPDRFDVLPSSANAVKQWRHWLKIFENFLQELGTKRENLNKLTVLVNYVNSDVYELFSEAATYDDALAQLKALYVKAPNEIYARHALATRKQQLDEYMRALKALSKDCNYQQVSANQYRDEAVRDAFISGLQSSTIHQRLLENNTLELEAAFNKLEL